MITVRLLGGRAHGWTCTIAADTYRIYVTMRNGRAEFVRALNQFSDQDRLKRGLGAWETYTHCMGLGPDEFGRLAFQCTLALPDPYGRTATRKVNSFLATRQSRPETADVSASRWAALTRVLSGTRHRLPDPEAAARIGTPMRPRADSTRRPPTRRT